MGSSTLEGSNHHHVRGRDARLSPSNQIYTQGDPEEDKPKTVKVMIKTVGGMKEEITKFSGGEPEEALCHVLLFVRWNAKWTF